MIRVSSQPSKLEQQKALLGIARERTPPAGVRWHEYAEIFPWIEGPAYEELKADIAKNGVLEPIVFLGDAILDGRNRYMAARDLGIEYPRVEYQSDDPLGFVISHNLKRRHLTDRQRADVAAKMAKLPKGANQHPPFGGPSVAKAAKMMAVPVRAVERAKAVSDRAIPEVKAAYEAGEIAPSVAADIATLPAENQIEVVRSADPRSAVKTAKARKRHSSLGKPADGHISGTAPVDPGDYGPHLKAGVVADDSASASVESFSDVDGVGHDGALVVSESTAILNEGEVESARPDLSSIGGQYAGSDDVLVRHEVAPPVVDAPQELAGWLDGIDFGDKRKRAFVITTPKGTYTAQVWPRDGEGGS